MAGGTCTRRGCQLPRSAGGLCGPHDVAEREARLRRLGFSETQLDQLLAAGFDVLPGATFAVRTRPSRRGVPANPPATS